MLEIKILDVVILLNCNLNCRGCNNFCDHNVSGYRSFEDIEKDFFNWKNKVNPARVQIMGGEAFLHKNLNKIILSARKHFPNTDLRLFTNGLLLTRHPKILETLKKANCVLVISVHSKEKKYLELLYGSLKSVLNEDFKPKKEKSIVSYGKIYEKDGVKIEFRDMTNHWYQTYQNGVIPFEDSNPKKSWDNCYFKYCVQLFEGKLWKCSQIAYLEPLMSRINNAEAWTKYRGIYKELSYDSDKTDFEHFKNNLEKEEYICGMCPANPEIMVKKNVW